jgi:hypothetical protein
MSNHREVSFHDYYITGKCCCKYLSVDNPCGNICERWRMYERKENIGLIKRCARNPLENRSLSHLLIFTLTASLA